MVFERGPQVKRFLNIGLSKSYWNCFTRNAETVWLVVPDFRQPPALEQEYWCDGEAQPLWIWGLAIASSVFW